MEEEKVRKVELFIIYLRMHFFQKIRDLFNSEKEMLSEKEKITGDLVQKLNLELQKLVNFNNNLSAILLKHNLI